MFNSKIFSSKIEKHVKIISSKIAKHVDVLKLLARQGCQMLDRKYGKCLPNLWQTFGKNF